MKLPPAPANLAWAASCWPAYRRFREALDRPAEVQLEFLRRLLARHCRCAYGREHGFDGIQSYDKFARRVPLADYEDLEPWIGRIRQGEHAVLSSDPVRRLVPTSGTVGGRKLIPFTAGLEADFNAALGPWMAGLFRSRPDLAFGRAYWSITPAIADEAGEPSLVPVGFEDDSRYLGGLRHRLVKSVLAAPSELRLVRDMETFRYLTLRCLLACRDLRLISVWHPSFLSLMLDGLPAVWEELLRDIHDGRCPRAGGLPAAVRRSLEVRAWPARVRELRNADPHRPETLWPRLILISCWGDAHAELAARELQGRFPGTVIQSKGLLATEAVVTIPFAGHYPPALHSHFFEFLDDRGAVHLVHELNEDEEYDVVVTTSGGLWRYRLHDRVRVTGRAQGTPSLRFLGRSGNVSDRFGEKLSEIFVARVFGEIIAALPAPPRFAMLAPDKDAAGWRYALYLEGETPPGLAQKLDAALRGNPHYAWCRDLGQLLRVRVVRVEAGAYEAYVTREMQSGRRLGEIKPAALSTRSDWADYFRCSPAKVA